jgi:hypothetical protein
MATGVASWSQTAATNATADSNINYAEGMAASALNDSGRALMSSVAKWRDDLAGTLTTGGTSTAYTLTSNQVFASLSAMNGAALRVKFNATNGANPTLNVDGLGAKAINTISGTAVPTGAIVSGTVHDLVYDNSNSVWLLIGAAYNPLGIVNGTVMLFMQTAAPSGWTKSTTHNDKAIRIVSGSASSGGSTAFTSVFASRTITQGNLPNVNFAISGNATQTIQVTTAGAQAIAPNSGSGTTTAAIAGGSTLYASNQFQAIDNLSINATMAAGTAASGGSGTAMDFAVSYVDVIAATKD